MKIRLTFIFCLIILKGYSQFENPFSSRIREAKIIVKDTNEIKIRKDTVLLKDGIIRKDTITKHIYLSVGVGTEALNLSSVSAAGKLLIKLNFLEGLSAMVGFNFSGAILGQKADSVPLSSIYFPDIASASFIGTMQARFLRLGNNCSVWLEGDISLEQRNIINNNSTDTVPHNFNILNFDFGPKLKWSYPREKVVFSESLLLEHVEIDDNTGENFNIVFENNHTHAPLPTVFNGFSSMTKVSINGIGMYLKTYSDFGRSTNLSYIVGLQAEITWH